jgi:putative alpha-1,2-mannosidase
MKCQKPSGNVAKTAALVERLCKEFSATEEGYPGDEDNGSMSACYVLSALGLYQMCPSRPDFTMSLPLFGQMTVKLANGKALTIDKNKLDPNKMKHVVAYSEIMRGGALSEIVSK